MPRFVANLSMFYLKLAFVDRFQSAAQNGFKTVELLFPYEHALWHAWLGPCAKHLCPPMCKTCVGLWSKPISSATTLTLDRQGRLVSQLDLEAMACPHWQKLDC